MSTREIPVEASRLTAEFQSLPQASQIEALVRLAYQLTLVGRDTYQASSLDLRHPDRLRCLNEIQHRVTSHVLALLTGDPHRYPDDVLASIILDQAHPEVGRQVAAAFARSLPSEAVV